MHTKPLSFWSTYPAFVLGATAGLIALTPLKATCHYPAGSSRGSHSDEFAWKPAPHSPLTHRAGTC